MKTEAFEFSQKKLELFLKIEKYLERVLYLLCTHTKSSPAFSFKEIRIISMHSLCTINNFIVHHYQTVSVHNLINFLLIKHAQEEEIFSMFTFFMCDFLLCKTFWCVGGEKFLCFCESFFPLSFFCLRTYLMNEEEKLFL